MLMRLSTTAKKITKMTFWAVFFSAVTTVTLSAEPAIGELEKGLNELIYRLSRSVVTVESYGGGSPGCPKDEAVQSLISSGLIYDMLGHILVSAQAVSGKEHIIVHFGNTTLPAQIRGIDYRTGLAVIYVNSRIGTPVTLGGSGSCAGQMVIAIGNSYGLPACPSLGFCAGSRPDEMIQFSAPITSGTVGGGVFDLSGKLLGLITGGLGSEGKLEVGLAIPAKKIPDIVHHLLTKGDRPVGYLGITTADIEIVPGITLTPSTQLARAVASSNHVINKGVMVTRVLPSSPAAKAGLRKGDLLLSVNHKPLESALELKNLIQQLSPGTIIEVGLLRNNTPYHVRLKVGKLSSPLTVSKASYALPYQSRYENTLLKQIDSLKKTLADLERQLKEQQK